MRRKKKKKIEKFEGREKGALKDLMKGINNFNGLLGRKNEQWIEKCVM